MKAIYNNIEMDISIDNSLFKQARELYIKTFKDSEMFCDVVLNDAFAISMDIENNKVVTCAFVREKRIRVAGISKKIPFMYGIATDEKYRNQGRARKTINAMFDFLKRQYDYILLCPANVYLYSFYEKLGFENLSFFNYEKGTILAKDEHIRKGSIKDSRIVYQLFNMYNQQYFATQERTLEQTKTRLLEVFADNGELYIVNNNEEDIGYFFLEDGHVVSEYINVQIKYEAEAFTIIEPSIVFNNVEGCPGVVIKKFNKDTDINILSGIKFYEMW